MFVFSLRTKNWHSLTIFGFSHCSIFNVLSDIKINATWIELNISDVVWKTMLLSNSVLTIRITSLRSLNKHSRVSICSFFTFFANRSRIVRIMCSSMTNSRSSFILKIRDLSSTTSLFDQIIAIEILSSSFNTSSSSTMTLDVLKRLLKTSNEVDMNQLLTWIADHLSKFWLKMKSQEIEWVKNIIASSNRFFDTRNRINIRRSRSENSYIHRIKRIMSMIASQSEMLLCWSTVDRKIYETLAKKQIFRFNYASLRSDVLSINWLVSRR